MASDPSATARRQAEQDLARGEAARALERLAGIDLGSDDEADFLAARAEAALGRLDASRARLIALRARLAVPSVMLELHLADVENRRGDVEAAIAALRAAIVLDPAVPIAYSNLASLLAATGRVAEARDALVRAAALAPADAALQLWLARLHASLGDGERALAAAAAAESAGPATAPEWREIGLLRAEYWKWDDADRALAEASRRDPGNSDTETLRAVVRQELGDAPGALDALALATARDPADLGAALSARLMLPQVYADAADLASWRARYAEGLARSAAEAARWRPRDALRLTRTNFLLAYQGEDDREPQRAYSALLADLAGKVHPEWRERRASAFDGGRRLRVGFVGAIFRDCTAGRYFERWITGLDPRRFERFVYHTAPLTDEFTARIAAVAEHFTTLRSGVEEIAQRIAADTLDVIVHPEVGMTPHSYLLAALRLAPVQLAGWGHPVTTGSDAIDGYLTCAMMEPEDAARHYVEPLVPLPGLGVDYAMAPAPPPTERTTFGLPAAGRMYLCAQSLFKVHPDMDAMLASILEADPEAVLVFFQATARAVTEQFARRLQGVLAGRGIPARGQLKFLPRMNGSGFRRALAAADIVLDTVHWSGGNTSLDAFAAATPVVALPGRFMRGRQSAAMLHAMGLAELVARDAAHYVRIAVDAARDRERNAGLRAAIVRERGALFDRPEPVAALQSALLELAAKS